jgi:hypothetical protein
VHPSINWAEKESHMDADEMSKVVEITNIFS